MRTEHNLKLDTAFFSRVSCGQKTFEIRKNDRDFQVGDRLILSEYDPKERKFIDYSSPITADIVYMSSFCQQEGYVVLGIKVIIQEDKFDDIPY